MARVLVLESDYESVEADVERIMSEFPLELEGKTVLVKPNMLGPYPPDSYVNTHPSLIRALVTRLRAAGALVTVGDNPGTQGYGAVARSAEVSRIADASMGAFENLSGSIESVALAGGRANVNVSKAVLDADLLISVPKFKTHTFTRITGAIKNSYGFLVGGDKARLHLEFPGYREFSELLVDVYRVRPPDLCIMDAVVGIQGNGPSNRSYYRAGKLLASDNGVAMDAVMARMMRMKPHKVRMLAYASEIGLGTIDVEGIVVNGNSEPLKGFRKPAPGVPQLLGSTWIGAFFPDLGHPRFDVDEDSCNGCGRCADACPAGAIRLQDGIPEYDYDRCISCFCCMELCEQQAISLHDTIRTRVYRLMGYLH